MKQFCLILGLLAISSFGHAQDIVIDSCGLNDDAKLNPYEVAYFKAGAPYSLEKSFDFSEKRICFLTGNYGAQPSSKSRFFEHSGKPRFENNDYPHIQLIVLDAEERELLQCDGILVTWSKVPVSKRNRKKFISNAILATQAQR